MTTTTALDLTAEGFLDVADARAFSGFSRSKLYRLMDAKKLAFAKPEGSRDHLISKSDLRRVMAEAFVSLGGAR